MLTGFLPPALSSAKVATCILAVKREIRWLLALCLAVLLAGIAYFAYKLASLWLPRTRHYFDSTRNTLAVFCASFFRAWRALR